jgi:hypothetical protein
MSGGPEEWAEPGGGRALWFPLVSQQLRFRSLTHVYLYHPTCQGSEITRLPLLLFLYVISEYLVNFEPENDNHE